MNTIHICTCAISYLNGFLYNNLICIELQTPELRADLYRIKAHHGTPEPGLYKSRIRVIISIQTQCRGFDTYGTQTDSATVTSVARVPK